MKNALTEGWDKRLIDWLFKILLGLITYLVQDIHTDVKEMREQIPAMKVEIDNLKDQELIKKFKSLKTKWDMKEEQLITYDSLRKTRTI